MEIDGVIPASALEGADAETMDVDMEEGGAERPQFPALSAEQLQVGTRVELFGTHGPGGVLISFSSPGWTERAQENTGATSPLYTAERKLAQDLHPRRGAHEAANPHEREDPTG